MEMNNLEMVEVLVKTGEECFEFEEKKLPILLLEFWQWSQSDLLNNTLRGILAEFIVCKALGIESKYRKEWDSFDLKSKRGSKIEVKSSAYLQSWKQTKLSNITFNIAPKRSWNSETLEVSKTSERCSDFYVFCLFHHKDKLSANVLDLNQWTFYLLKSEILNKKCLTRKTISLNTLLALNPIKCGYGEINEQINKIETI